MSGPVQPPLTVETVDGATVGRPITKIKVTNGDLTISGSTATIDTSGGGGTGTIGGSTTVNQIAFGDSTASTITSSGNLQFLSGQNLYVAGRIQIGNAAGTKLTTVSSQNLILDTNEGTDSGNITIEAGVNGQISITPDGTGLVKIDGVGINNSSIATGYILKATSATEAGWVAESTSGIGGSIANTQVAVGSGTDTISGSSALTLNGSVLTVENQIELSSTGAAGILKNSQNNQDLRLQVSGTGNVRIENQTTNTDSQLNVKGNGTGTPQISLSNDSKAVTIKCDENQKLKVAGGSSSFIFDASSGTGGITWPDGTTQTTAASGGDSYGALANPTSMNSTSLKINANQRVGGGTYGGTTAIEYFYGPVAYPFVSPHTGTIADLTIEVTSAAAGRSVNVGIYSADSTTGLPSSLVASANFSVATSAQVTQTSFTGTPSVTRGSLYWIAHFSDSATSGSGSAKARENNPGFNAPSNIVAGLISSAYFGNSLPNSVYFDGETSLPSSVTASDCIGISRDLLDVIIGW